ncbi:conserved hypothetical protein [Pseudoxanthomonas sp. GM95]|uniref:PA2169 family four-helix-bundle protein n=1 Tax=Pseudoxanthomonas sp. GM95 TaxID=1881043 RepID=UPI0008CB0C61|nr:PA2169 family four-helix-bundle protein [Pseudoxanthomonas sp. GM95]SEL17178.1 conserved hypothetical protein [Pseudoxanthomonas sp. GM95]
MSIEKKTTRELNALIEIARDGEHFYREASKKIHDKALADLFTHIADAKQAVVTKLSAVVFFVGLEPAKHGTVLGMTRKLYAKVRAGLGGGDFAYLTELEEAEDRLLNEFIATATDVDISIAGREAVAGLIPSLKDTRKVLGHRRRELQLQ